MFLVLLFEGDDHDHDHDDHAAEEGSVEEDPHAGHNH